jgi:methyl-accepting chemotaxis protein
MTIRQKQAETEVMSIKSGGMVKDAIDQINNGANRAGTAVARIVTAQRNVLNSMGQVEATVIKIKQVTQDQARRSEAEVSATTAEQQTLVEVMAAKSRKRTGIMLIGALIIGIGVLALNGFLAMGIRKPLHVLESTISEIAASRDLRRSVNVKNNDEIGRSIKSKSRATGSARWPLPAPNCPKP